jgi:hypothetical protein
VFHFRTAQYRASRAADLIAPFPPEEDRTLQIRDYDEPELAAGILLTVSTAKLGYLPAALPPQPVAEQAEMLQGLISNLVQPETWRGRSASRGSITCWAGRLWIIQSPQVQTQIRSLVKQLKWTYSDPSFDGSFDVGSGPSGIALNQNAARKDADMYVRVYDVRDFGQRCVLPVIPTPRPHLPAPLFVAQLYSSIEPRAIPRSLGPYVNLNDYAWHSRAALIDMLVRSIREAVDPDSWRGSGITYVAATGGLLIIQQTTENHRRIQRLLHHLRELRAAIDRGEGPTMRPIDWLGDAEEEATP